MTAPRFDELIHPSTRLSIVATLAASEWADFAYLAEALSLSDSALSKQLSTLEAAGYVTTERRTHRGRRTVRARLTAQGRTAFAGHVAALQEIVDGSHLGPARDAAGA
ncbi:transcriptional regulator [Branchiibius sp. NY16-3462-2]|uniref:transcriptional regulator n=1 Tax=Branchiibius sp. NY16-3462-2 TaxID=1807500 RepID=UPI000797E308|nr:transcriptional regulator [Branchiibius sp. NY16-3462-2]KYH43829.1 MarR family transcriptional regulator [Branchiibius sp. NY16-3462-2]